MNMKFCCQASLFLAINIDFFKFDVTIPAGYLLWKSLRSEIFYIYGKVVKISWLPWPLKLRFPPGSPAYEAHAGETLQEELLSPPLYATQIYSMIGALIICLVLIKFFKHKKNNGEVFILMGLLYSVNRFIIEFFRDEPAFAFGFTDDQIINIIVFVIAAGAFFYLRRRKSLQTEPAG